MHSKHILLIGCGVTCIAGLLVTIGLSPTIIVPHIVDSDNSRFTAVVFNVTGYDTVSASGKYCSPCYMPVLNVEFTLNSNKESCMLYGMVSRYNPRDKDSMLSVIQDSYPLNNKINGYRCNGNPVFRCPCITESQKESAFSTLTTFLVFMILGGVIILGCSVFAIMWAVKDSNKEKSTSQTISV